MPQGSRLFLDLSLQKQWAGSQEFGPYALHDVEGLLAATFPRTRVSFDHTAFKMGLGVRW